MSQMTNYTDIFWDWNGTLLDDADYCIATVNKSLKKRNMPVLTKERYQKLFCFPIVNYYIKLGFDFEKESYDALAEEYNRNYSENDSCLKLRQHTKEVLAVFKSKGIRQYILSACERKLLEKALREYNIDKYFEKVLCPDDYLAAGKISLGTEFAKTLPSSSKKLLIGDTVHDLETAQAIGADCILLLDGHSSKETLCEQGTKVLSSLYELYPIVLGNRHSEKKITAKNADALEQFSFDTIEAEPKNFRTAYETFYDDIKNIHKVEDW